MSNRTHTFFTNIGKVLEKSVFLSVTTLLLISVPLGLLLGAVFVHWYISIPLVIVAYITRLIYAGVTGK